MSTIDIKDFSLVSSLNLLDSVLLSRSGDGGHGKMRVGLIIDAVKSKVQDGKEVELRRGATAIEWRYVGGEQWQSLIPIEDLKLKYSDLSPDQVRAVKLKYSDLTEEDKRDIRRPAEEMVTTLTETNRQATTAEQGRVRAEESRVRAEQAREERARNLRNGTDGRNGADGKTPILKAVRATAGATAGGQVSKTSTDPQGNPEYTLELTLPRGEQGLSPHIELGSVTTLEPSQSATAALRASGTHTDGRPKYMLDLSIPRGVAGSLAEGDASGLSVVFSESSQRVKPASGGTLGAIVGRMVKWLGDLKAVAFSGRFGDLVGRPTTLSGYGITDGASSNHNHNGVYALVNHSHNYAASNHNHSGVYASVSHTHSDYLPKAYYEGANSVTSLTNLPTTKRIVRATLSGATDLTLSGALAVGQELIVDIVASGSFSQPIPTGGGWSSRDGGSLDVKSGKGAEMSILCVASGVYSVSCKVTK